MSVVTENNQRRQNRHGRYDLERQSTITYATVTNITDTSKA